MIEKLGPAAHAALRVAAGLLFMQHGLQKTFGLLGGNQPDLVSLLGLAGIMEVVGGPLLIAGVLTRPVALVLSLQMVIAYFLNHYPRPGFPVQNGGELALLYAFIFAFLGTNGAGPYSVDAAMRDRK